MTSILYLSHSALPSKEANSVHVMKMCQAFAQNDVSVTLIARQGEGYKDKDDLFDKYNIHTPFSLSFYDLDGFWLSRYLLYLKKHFSFLRFGILPELLFWLFAPQVEKVAVLLYARNFCALLAYRKSFFIVECHRPPAHILEKWILGSLLRRRYFKGLVVISDKMKTLFMQSFPKLCAETIHVLHDGADDPGKLNGTRLEGFITTGLNIGYVGRFYKGRGLPLIAACAKALPHHRFHMVGGTKNEAMVEGCNWPDNVIFHGSVPHAEVGNYLSAFDAVLAPYQRKVAVAGNSGNTADFMSPLKIFEYMAYEKVILCSDLPVIHEVLEHGVTAYLLPPDKPEVWAAHLEQVFLHKEEAKTLAKSARNVFLERYTWTKRAKEALTLGRKNL